MPGVIEDMPFEERMQRIRAIAVALVELVKQVGQLGVMAALEQVATQLRLAISQIKYGLNYALSRDMVRLNEDETELIAA